MIRTEAIQSLVNSIEGTTRAAGLQAVVKKADATSKGTVISQENDKDLVTYVGDIGELVLEFEGVAMHVLCRKADQDQLKEVAIELFDCESDGWSMKDVKSAANEASESIGKFFGTEVVYEADSKSKASGKNAAKSETAAADVATTATKAAVKQAKKTADSFEPIHLALRIESIYPELKGKVEENLATYGKFLPEEYFQNYGTAPILDSIRKEDRPIVKRLFKAFNTFYDEGEKDTQSLIAVSILGMSFAKEPELLEKNRSYMNDTLGPAVEKIVDYLQSSRAKRKIQAYENPKAYKPSFKEKMKKSGKKALLG